MKLDFFHPFVSSAREVLSLEMHETIERGDLRLENGFHTTDDVTVIISLIGMVNGTVFFSMSEEVAVQLASALMSEKFDSLDKLAQSGIAELGNVITGRASMKFAEAGYETDISTPSLIIGRGATISTLEYSRLIVPLTTSIGPISIHLALREGPHANLKVAPSSASKTFEITKE
jgi:Predicted inhibitor of MCP methylation, homolog of CheC